MVDMLPLVEIQRVMCDKKNSFHFTDTECLVLSFEFKLPDENQVLLRVPRENNMYNADLKNIGPFGDLTCLFAKAILDESNLWHRRLGHINFKIMNKLVTRNLVRGLPSKVFENDHTCVACKKGKQHRASCKTKPVSSVNQPLQRLHMDLFGPTFVKSLNKKSYCLVVTDDYSRFTWVFFLATKDETSPILKTFIIGIENQLSLKNTKYWFYETSGSPVTILNTLDSLGKFDGKVDEGFLVRGGKCPTICAFSVWSSGSNNPQNTDGDAAFEEKEHEFEGRKPQSDVNVSPSSSAQSKKHDDKTKREAKGKSPVESSTGYRNLSVKFEYFFDNSINQDNAVGSLVPAVGPTHGKSLYVDSSQLPDDQNMLELEDITDSDDEEDVGFEDPDHPDKVYKVVALYGLHQAPRAWQKGNILLVQIYVDDIIFGSTNKDLCKAFEKLMKDKFQMSSMGELAFFFGLQVKQKKDRILVSQDKYVAEILRKFGLTDRKSASTLINTEKPLLKDLDGEDVDVHAYRSMIGSLMYLNSSRPDIMFAVYAYAYFQVTPKASNLHAVKRIFRYLKGKPHLGLWYPKDSPFNSVAYSDSD
uniref:Putative ribonuclease H-like domain-containing protein n=1 Tax=Tanacetum cinerariifolium TaxID=118510 RepID=A0A699GNB5_TANCI|nr:putative ribonuclease H-like domain-containing protein [Tanacetum cinerariifolium]